MPDQGSIAVAEAASYVRLGTLVRLRWMAVAGQTAAVLVVHFGLDFPLPYWRVSPPSRCPPASTPC